MKSSITFLMMMLLLASAASALVWNPEIITPSARTKWRAGETYTVQWKTTVVDMDIPDGVNGTIKLGYLEEGSINEHLYWDLASAFPLNSGAQSVTLPSDLETKKSYIIVVMGNSGNASPKFTIKAARPFAFQ
ncbi:hypothetical protein BDB00DRAFT_32097 [Zychaea mexicana]|uniref:uncharacterized protein n=1 Tax=Zychaea mexicana TaxID=64656 RepID=UPI0022FF4278|nr:uncharacterized protein BDB00DRAFT_32097 [Zychaea mexicana]KAI9488710.1 hypothetical protein BDB00DRAFT_32097 [Zychaea mexicana]